MIAKQTACVINFMFNLSVVESINTNEKLLWPDDCPRPRNCSDKAVNDQPNDAKRHKSSTNVKCGLRPPSEEYHIKNPVNNNNIF